MAQSKGNKTLLAFLYIAAHAASLQKKKDMTLCKLCLASKQYISNRFLDCPAEWKAKKFILLRSPYFFSPMLMKNNYLSN